MTTAEDDRLAEIRAGSADWRRWGTYLSERAWGTVREDYSADGDAWSYFPFEHARSRAYRWNEDGLAGWCDADQTICLGRVTVQPGEKSPEGLHPDEEEIYVILAGRAILRVGDEHHEVGGGCRSEHGVQAQCRRDRRGGGRPCARRVLESSRC